MYVLSQTYFLFITIYIRPIRTAPSTAMTTTVSLYEGKMAPTDSCLTLPVLSYLGYFSCPSDLDKPLIKYGDVGSVLMLLNKY